MHSWVFRHRRSLEAIYLRAAPGHVRALPQLDDAAWTVAPSDGLRVLVLIPERRRNLHAASG